MDDASERKKKEQILVTITNEVGKWVSCDSGPARMKCLSAKLVN